MSKHAASFLLAFWSIVVLAAALAIAAAAKAGDQPRVGMALTAMALAVYFVREVLRGL